MVQTIQQGDATITIHDDGSITVSRPGQNDEAIAGGSDGGPDTDAAQSVASGGGGESGTGGGAGAAPQQPSGQALTQGEIIVALRNWLNGDRTNGLSPNEAKQALEGIGANADLVDNEIADFNAGQTDPSIEGDIAGPGPTTPTTGGQGEGIDEDFFFASPEERGFQLQTTRGGRQQLFNEFIAQGLPSFGGGIARRAAQSRFSPFSTSFNLGQALSGSPGGLFDDTSQSFTDFLGGSVPSGADIRGQLGDLLGVLGGSASEITGGGLTFLDQLGDIDFSGQGRGIAFNTANAASGLGLGNPFRQGFGNLLGRQLDRFLGQGGTPLDFLNQFQGQGFGSFF